MGRQHYWTDFRDLLKRHEEQSHEDGEDMLISQMRIGTRFDNKDCLLCTDKQKKDVTVLKQTNV